MRFRTAFALTAFLWLGGTSASAAPLAVPELRAPVEDLAGVLDSGDAQALDSDIRELLAQTGVQAQLLLIPSLEGEAIEEYSIRVVEKWKLGSKSTELGFLLLVAVKEHRMRIEVGRGLEGSLTDLETSRMIREILAPAFRQGQYYAGLKSFLDRVRAVTKGEGGAASTANAGETPRETLPAAAGGLLILALLVALVLDWVLRANPGLRGGVYALGCVPLSIFAYLHPALGIPILLVLGFPVLAFFLGLIGLLNLLQILMMASRGGGGGGGSGGGGSWGGGGGSFSGGGASGSW